MKILAVDTSSKTAYVSIAEAQGDKVKPLVSYSYEAPSHTTALTKMIDSVLRLSGLSLDDIDLYAASVGPGSFTGVRIGVSVIKGFAFVDSKPCVGVSSLDALAYGALGCRGIITPVIDARRGTFYTSAYLSDGRQITKLTSEGQLEFSEYFATIAENLKEHKLVLTGDYAEKIAEKAAENGISADVAISNPGYGAALSAFAKYNCGDKEEFTDRNLLPVYLKKSQAEREREERLAGLGENK